MIDGISNYYPPETQTFRVFILIILTKTLFFVILGRSIRSIGLESHNKRRSSHMSKNARKRLDKEPLPHKPINRRKFKAVVVLSLVLVIALAMSYGGYQYFSAKALATDLAERKAIFDGFLKQAKVIVERTGDPQAKAVYEYLRDNSVLVKPHSKGYVVLAQRKDPSTRKWVAIMPLTEEDVAAQMGTQLGDYWRELFSSHKFIANYLPKPNLIVIRDKMAATDVWKGLILLHEGNHALIMAMNPYDWHNSMMYCADEADTHIFQNSLIESLGGQPYKDFLKKRVAEMRTKVREEKMSPCHEFPRRADNYPELDNIFGPPLSQLERDLRGTHTWLQISFKLIDEDCEVPPKTKIGLMQSLYQQDGILPKE